MSAPIFPDAFHARTPATLFGMDDTVVPMPEQSETIGFIAGTRVATPMGYVAVERLSAGDKVLTADGRHARLTWVGMTRVEAKGPNAPVCFETGVMDNMRPLRLGQGHRVRVAGWRAELLFDAEAVLATAKSFVNGEDVVIEDDAGVVTYVHLMFDRHEVVLAENIACETLRPGPDGLRQLDAMTRRALMSEVAGVDIAKDDGVTAALPILSAAEERVLLAA